MITNPDRTKRQCIRIEIYPIYINDILLTNDGKAQRLIGFILAFQ